jgi:RNA polymerase sigma-70 factor, ECF subfamily
VITFSEGEKEDIMYQENNDNELIRQAIIGDKEAIEKIVKAYQPLMHYIAKTMVNNSDTINDIVQESSILVYRSLHQLREPASFRGWLSSIVTNTARRHIHSQKRTPLSLEVLQQEDTIDEALKEFSSSDPYEEFEKKYIATTIIDIVMQLSAKEREVVILFYYLDYSIQEICDLLHITKSSVKSRLYKARKHLAPKVPSFLHIMPSISSERKRKMSQFEGYIPGFTDDQIAAYQYAHSEAHKFGHKRLGTEHFLLSIVHTATGDLVQLLQKKNIEESKVRDALTLGYQDPEERGPGITSQLQDALEVSYELARQLEVPKIDCTHLLFSFLQIHDSGAFHILESLHIDIEAFFTDILSLLLKDVPSQKITQNNQRLLRDIYVLKKEADQESSFQRKESNYISFGKHIEIYKNLMKNKKYERRREELEKWNNKIARLQEISKNYSMESRFPSFSLQTSIILSNAEKESKKYSARVSPAFLFLGFMYQNEQSSLSKNVLEQTFDIIGIDRVRIYKIVSSQLEQGKEEFVLRKGNALDNVYLSSWSDISIFAYEEAIRRKSSTVEPEHLFLGLLHYLDLTPVPSLELVKEDFRSFEITLALASKN